MKNIKQRKGFTLIELLVAILIFGFMLTSMATMYSTANKHMFQNYRSNKVKTQLTAAAKSIQNKIITATRIDIPSYGSNSNILAFASNIDASGCYPINTSVTPQWHYFCVDNNRRLYYHTGFIGGGSGCPGGGWNPNSVYPFIRCGSRTLPNEQVIMLADNITNPIGFPSSFFSRNVPERNVVRVRLRALWNADLSGMGNASRTIDVSMDTYISASISVQ